MRHAIILGGFSLLFAVLMGFAYQYDQSRHNANIAGQQAALDAELDRLESQFLTQAYTLLTLAKPGDPLLAELDAAKAALAGVPEFTQRDDRFQQLAGAVRTAVLSASTTHLNEPQLQEWRRTQDQMNGALHRREVLLKEHRAAPPLQ